MEERLLDKVKSRNFSRQQYFRMAYLRNKTGKTHIHLNIKR